MRVLAVTATCGRHTCIERLVRMFMMQDYAFGHTLLIYNNSDIPQTLSLEVPKELPKKVVLINNHISLETGRKYENLGQIYTDALCHVSREYDCITFMDDDDLFLPSHISLGVNGLERARAKGKCAYKPAKSYFRHPGGVELMSNTLEPSIFTELEHIKEHGFSDETTAQHLQWVNPLVHEHKIFVDEEGTPTLIYNWGDDFPTFKTSGNANSPNNFNSYRIFSRDHGDRVITPIPENSVLKLFRECKVYQ